jgi:hypothetical protein
MGFQTYTHTVYFMVVSVRYPVMLEVTLFLLSYENVTTGARIKYVQMFTSSEDMRF